jgi:hypothetical protein
VTATLSRPIIIWRFWTPPAWIPSKGHCVLRVPYAVGRALRSPVADLSCYRFSYTNDIHMMLATDDIEAVRPFWLEDLYRIFSNHGGGKRYEREAFSFAADFVARLGTRLSPLTSKALSSQDEPLIKIGTARSAEELFRAAFFNDKDTLTDPIARTMIGAPMQIGTNWTSFRVDRAKLAKGRVPYDLGHCVGGHCVGQSRPPYAVGPAAQLFHVAGPASGLDDGYSALVPLEEDVEMVAVSSSSSSSSSHTPAFTPFPSVSPSYRPSSPEYAPPTTPTFAPAEPEYNPDAPYYELPTADEEYDPEDSSYLSSASQSNGSSASVEAAPMVVDDDYFSSLSNAFDAFESQPSS